MKLVRLLIFPMLFLTSCNSTPPFEDTVTYRRGDININESKSISIQTQNDSFSYAVIELDSIKVVPYFGSVQKLWHHRRTDLVHFIKTILVTEKAINFVRIKDSTAIINLIQTDTLNYFEDARFLNYSWVYYYYHDIYSSFFSYPEVSQIIVLSNCVNVTYLPTSGDIDPVKPPSRIMHRKWYKRDVDYLDIINLLDSNNFDDYRNRIVSIKVIEEINF